VVSTCLLAFLLLGAPARASSNPVADSHLGRRQYRLAAQAYRESLTSRPDDPELKLGLARAWAGLGWCDKALPVFDALHGTAVWDTGAALDMGTCLEAEARGSEAVAALEEALILGGGGPGLTVDLAWEALMADDQPLFQAITEQLIQDDPLSKGALFLQGVRAWNEGDLDGMRWAFEDLRRLQPRVPKADLVEAWAALEQGDPEGAAEALRSADRLNRMHLPEVATWLAEANRRMGRPNIAGTILFRQMKEKGEVPPQRLALRLRLEADLNGPAAAAPEVRDMLARFPYEREIVATAWYVATLAHDDAQADALARRYAAIVPPGRWPLAALMPLPSETP